MNNRDVFHKDPTTLSLLNQGVAKVADVEDARQLKTLRFELETFVCEGRYEQGLRTILEAYLERLGGADKTEQPAGWVSGFYGSGKSHLVKILRYLWVDYRFEADGATARGVAHLTVPVQDALKELTTQGKRHGLRAASGTLKMGGNVRLNVLSIVCQSVGLPAKWFKARFVLWLKARGLLDAVQGHLGRHATSLDVELEDMYVSDPLAEALLAADPNLAGSIAGVHRLLADEYPEPDDIEIDDLVAAIRKVLTVNRRFPCTLIVLDEVQQYIGEDSTASRRAYEIQEIAEACSSRFDNKLLLVATGQDALSHTPLLQKLMGRFTVQIDLRDTDVEAVTRRMVLAKKADRGADVQAALNSAKGEIARHLFGTQIEPRSEDGAVLVADYPLLPVRRRFWERVLRAVDRAGTSAQLRSMLRIVLEATQAVAGERLGHVIPADFLFDQKAAEMRMTGALLPEVHEAIIHQRQATPHGPLRYRLAALIFLIGKLPREPGADLGVRANADTLADLLVEDLPAGSAPLRTLVPELLARMVQERVLMQVGQEYRLQTPESSAWNEDYEQRYARLANDTARMSSLVAERLAAECHEQVKDVKRPRHGKSNPPRKLELCFSDQSLAQADADIPVRVYDEWSDDEKVVRAEVLQASTDSPTVYVFLPKTADTELKKALASRHAARETLDARGEPSTPAGQEARAALETRHRAADADLRTALAQVFRGALVFQAGAKTDLPGLSLADKVKLAAETALTRLYPQFDAGDDPRWDTVIERARQGDAAPLKALDYQGNSEAHPVCARVLGAIGAGKKGTQVRDLFTAGPYGWPPEAVEGALLALCASGHLRCAYQGAPLEVRRTEKRKWPQYDFRAENVIVTAPQRMGLRGLYQDAAGLTCKANEEAATAGPFLDSLRDLAGRAGGPAPLPEVPDTLHLEDLAAMAGNEQLVALYEARDRLKAEAAQWRDRAEAIKSRRGRWDQLQRLLQHAAGLPAAGEVRPQVEAILAQRSLLASPDPIPPLCNKLTGALRVALVAVHADFKTAREGQLLGLEAAEAWRQLQTEERAEVLRQYDLDTMPAIQTGTEAELLTCLDGLPLAQWAMRRDALPQRVQNALMEAALRGEPKAVAVALPRATLKTPEELDAWLSLVRQEVLKQLPQGPVIV
jgi:hypothetical protein